MQTIPLEPIPNQQLNIILSGRNVTLAVYSRAGFCYLDLGMGGDWTARGMLIVTGESILRDGADFPGRLVLVDVRSRLDAQFDPSMDMNADPIWTQLNDRFMLYYMTDNEYQTYASAAGVPA